ncbi:MULTISPECIES: DUF982 domain-containing protein [unclassified Sinorhizobium]|uniref:DUF982 domain-containing protein n=1 Tax=unclassified Sinorhizobium TaxID=2613772 RepID=UPI003523A27B
MALNLFERPIYIKQKNYMQEIGCLDDVFDLLEEWPEGRRDLSYETLVTKCREAACGRFPIAAVRENFRRFVKKAGMLAEIEDVPNFATLPTNRNVGNS